MHQLKKCSMAVSNFHVQCNNADWTNVIVQSLLRQIELNTCIHRHKPLYDFSIIGLFYKSHWYNTDWTSVIVQSLLRRIELNTCIHRHLPLYDFSIIGRFYKSHWYKMPSIAQHCLNINKQTHARYDAHLCTDTIP